MCVGAVNCGCDMLKFLRIHARMRVVVCPSLDGHICPPAKMCVCVTYENEPKIYGVVYSSTMHYAARIKQHMSACWLLASNSMIVFGSVVVLCSSLQAHTQTHAICLRCEWADNTCETRQHSTQHHPAVSHACSCCVHGAHTTHTHTHRKIQTHTEMYIITSKQCVHDFVTSRRVRTQMVL